MVKASLTWDGPTKEVESCGMQLRWHHAELQQRWTISTVTNGAGSRGVVIAERHEWRDVPVDDKPDRKEKLI